MEKQTMTKQLTLFDCLPSRYRWSLGQVVHLKSKQDNLPVCGAVGEYPDPVTHTHVDYNKIAPWGAPGQWLEALPGWFKDCQDCFKNE
jgi:hypothetical protein